MAYKKLKYIAEDGIATIVINRPRARNAIDFQTMDELAAALETIESSAKIGVLIITGAGDKSFCAGGDLREFKSLETSDDARRMCNRMQLILTRLESLNIPTVAAANGDALGGGCEIITACDIRLASEKARFGFRQIRFGIITGWGGTQRLLRIVGRSASLNLLLTGELITAPQALAIGLVDKVLPQEKLMDGANYLARQIAENPLECVQSYKKAVNFGHHDSLEAAIAYETELFCQLWVSDFRKEAFKRFTKKMN